MTTIKAHTYTQINDHKSQVNFNDFLQFNDCGLARRIKCFSTVQLSRHNIIIYANSTNQAKRKACTKLKQFFHFVLSLTRAVIPLLYTRYMFKFDRCSQCSKTEIEK